MKSGFGLGLALATSFVVLLPIDAAAVSYTFSYCFDNNSSVCSEIAQQMTVDVTDAGGGKVNFEFQNNVGEASSVTALYFDAGGFLGNMVILDEAGGADFTEGSASPSDPPGGEQAIPPFETTASLLADANNPKPQKGLNSIDDGLTLQFDIENGLTFTDIIAALNLGPNEGDGIRIAAHVQGIGRGGQLSDTFICCSPGSGGGNGGSPTPEPATASLFGLAALAAAYRVRRNKHD